MFCTNFFKANFEFLFGIGKKNVTFWHIERHDPTWFTDFQILKKVKIHSETFKKNFKIFLNFFLESVKQMWFFDI